MTRQTVTHLALDQLVSHPDNVRDDLGDLTDPDVRTARKVVANALVALNKTLNAAGTSGLAVAPAKRTRGAGAHALRERIAALGVEPRAIRAWVKDHGHDVPMVGMLPGWAVDLYEQAHAQQEAS